MRTAIIIAILATAIAAFGADNSLGAKAARAFDNEEWAGAAALYMLLADKTPEAALPYARLMIAQEMRADTAGSIATMERALANAVPLDSVLTPAREAAFALMRPDMYEALLLRLQRSLPYLHRVLDIRLLRFYNMRRNTEGMTAYSRKMLAGNPADTEALATLADAAVMNGDMDAAKAYWTKILEYKPDHYLALASLTNTLADTDPAAAADYARRALAIRPNTTLRKLLDKLLQATASRPSAENRKDR